MEKIKENDMKKVLTSLSKLNLNEMFSKENMRKWKNKGDKNGRQ